MPEPSLTRLDAPGSARGLVLVLHGGTQTSRAEVDGRSASWRRMAAMQRAITPRAHEAGVSTWLLRYGERGWNDAAPVADARWALEFARQEVGEVPVVLLGHSMGGRTAVYVADDPNVTGVVGLAPWWQSDDPVSALTGRHVVAAHGRTDKITSARRSRALLDRARPLAASTAFHDMGPIGHYMLRRIRSWNAVAATSALAMLDPDGDRRQSRVRE